MMDEAKNTVIFKRILMKITIYGYSGCFLVKCDVEIKILLKINHWTIFFALFLLY